MSRFGFHAWVDGTAVPAVLAMALLHVTSDWWSGEDVFFLQVVPLLLIGGGLATALLLRRTRPTLAQATASFLVPPFILVTWVIVASFMP